MSEYPEEPSGSQDQPLSYDASPPPGTEPPVRPAPVTAASVLWLVLGVFVGLGSLEQCGKSLGPYPGSAAEVGPLVFAVLLLMAWGVAMATLGVRMRRGAMAPGSR